MATALAATLALATAMATVTAKAEEHCAVQIGRNREMKLDKTTKYAYARMTLDQLQRLGRHPGLHRG